MSVSGWSAVRSKADMQPAETASGFTSAVGQEQPSNLSAKSTSGLALGYFVAMPADPRNSYTQDVAGVTIVLPPIRMMIFFQSFREYSSLFLEHRINSSTAILAADSASTSARPHSTNSAFNGASKDFSWRSKEDSSWSGSATLVPIEKRTSIANRADTRIESSTIALVA